jgi:hypothetical protein
MKFIDDSRIPPEPYPELWDVLVNLTDQYQQELAGNLVGIYLVGSLAIGDFDLDSDIDFLVVTGAEITEANRISLEGIQKKIQAMDCYPAKHLEGSFISITDLQDGSTAGKKSVPYFDNGSTTMEMAVHDNQWHVRWVLREHGITLLGPNPETLLPPIPQDKFLKEIKTELLQALKYFEDDINRPLCFSNSRFGQSFFVLTACRMLHSLSTGTVQSKKAGAEWARQFVDPKWRKIIDQAWQERQGVRFMVKIAQRAEPALLRETLEFMKYAVGLTEAL